MELLTINRTNLKSIVKTVIYPFQYDDREPRLPRKQSNGYNLQENTNNYFNKLFESIFCSKKIDEKKKYAVILIITNGKCDKLGSADLDNYSKAILDGITNSGYLWKDDAQVDLLHITREYSDKIRSQIEIELFEIT